MGATTTERFTRMDESTAEQWAVIGEETRRNQPRVADRILLLLRSLADVTDGFATDQLTHCLQTATLAERAGADDEVVVASLCHDIGKAVSVPNHGAIAAEMLKPYVSDDIYHAVKHHQDFQGRYYYEHLGLDKNARDRFAGEPWYDMAEKLVDRWDAPAFDPSYDIDSLDSFAPEVGRVFSRPKRMAG
jgi:predicted HD phosphohydrolase